MSACASSSLAAKKGYQNLAIVSIIKVTKRLPYHADRRLRRFTLSVLKSKYMFFFFLILNLDHLPFRRKDYLVLNQIYIHKDFLHIIFRMINRVPRTIKIRYISYNGDQNPWARAKICLSLVCGIR